MRQGLRCRAFSCFDLLYCVGSLGMQRPTATAGAAHDDRDE